MPRVPVLRAAADLSIAPLVACLLFSCTVFACGGSRPVTLGLENSRLSPCPSRPNCVSSDAEDPQHHIAPFELAKPADEAWPAVRDAVAALPRTVVITERPGYLHAKSRSLIFRFADDLELQLRMEEGIIAIRSASRLGYSDFGVNRKRVEQLRAALSTSGVIR